MIEIQDELKNNFFIYASCVNNERSFPDARDGLKPGMRATLWEMFTKGYSSTRPHVKCAKVSGGTIATWWPHGDVGIYEAMVRLSQNWVNNLVAIDFHGSNGSILGGPDAANQRYTECRLAKSAEDCYFATIKKNVVDFIDNFSEDEKWPQVFPAIAPILMINGSSGIGYTIAQDWLPHNLTDLAERIKEYITTGNIKISELAPDFPTGGVIINKKEIADIYKTGKGKVVLRGRVVIEGNSIKITELPYQIYAESFIQKVKDLVNADVLTGIEDIYNKSDDSGMLIEIECSADPQIVLNKLYKLTELQTTFSANQMALVNGVPRLLNLEDYIKIYIEHNINVIKREYSYDLQKASQRLEIVSGLIRATTILDEIIHEIRASKSALAAVNTLKEKFLFTAIQAQAIVDMRLGKLANTEVDALTKEQLQLTKVIAACNRLLNSDGLQKKEFLKRLGAFTTEYGWSRRTDVLDIDLAAEKVNNPAKTKVAENYTILLDSSGNLKRTLTSQYKTNKKVNYITTKIAEDQKLLLISNKGKMYKLPVKQIPKASINSVGTSASSLVPLQGNEKIIQIFNGLESKSYIFFITKNGLAKKTLYQEVRGLSKNIGALVMKITPDDEIILCKLVESEKITVSYNNKEKTLNTDRFIVKSRTAGGVVAVKVKPNYYVTLFE